MNKTVICLVPNQTSNANQVADAFYQAGHGNLSAFCIITICFQYDFDQLLLTF